MKRAGIGLSVGLAVVVAIMLNARPVVAVEAAIVIHDNGQCGMPGSDANGDITFGGIGSMFSALENDGKVMIKCKGQDLLNESGRAQNYEGFICGLLAPSSGELLVTTDSHANVAPNGNGSLTCTFTKPSTK
jgi:hypothetical protein